MIETHTHLCDEQFDADRDAALDRARAVGVKVFIEIAEEEGQWAKAQALADTHPDVYWAAGQHPYYANRADAAFLKRLEEVLRHPRCVALGEVGLDYHRTDSPRDVQRRVLLSLLRVAARAHKPVVLHCREFGADQTQAQRDLLSALDEVPLAPGLDAPVGVAHCFQGTAETAQALMERGFLLGADAPLTYPGAKFLRALMAALPLASLVLETDSPYLPPQSHRGKRNEPSHLPAVARALAELKGLPIETVAELTSANARRLFRLP